MMGPCGKIPAGACWALLGAHMRIARLLVALASCCAVQATTAQDYSSEERQRLLIANVRHLCEWAKTNAPEGNPVVITACTTDGYASLQQADLDLNHWWAHWRDTDEALFDRLSKEWNAELA